MDLGLGDGTSMGTGMGFGMGNTTTSARTPMTRMLKQEQRQQIPADSARITGVPLADRLALCTNLVLPVKYSNE